MGEPTPTAFGTVPLPALDGAPPPAMLWAEVAAGYVALGELAWYASITSAPKSQAIMEWMRAPRLGDLVFLSPVRRQPPIDRVGTWTATWAYLGEHDDPDCEGVPYRDRASEQVYLIATLDGRWVKWTDVGLYRIPRDGTECGHL